MGYQYIMIKGLKLTEITKIHLLGQDNLNIPIKPIHFSEVIGIHTCINDFGS